MSKKISHSAWKKYVTCPRMYKYHYIERLRPKGTSSPLAFGTAIDTGITAFLLDDIDPVRKFREVFKFEDLQDVQWDAKDYDEDLFTSDQLQTLESSEWGYKCWASMRIKGRLLIEEWMRVIYPLFDEVLAIQKDIDGAGPGILDIKVKLKDGRIVIVDNKTSKNPYKFDAVTNDSQLALYASREGAEWAAFAVMVKTISKDKVCVKCKHKATSSHKTCNNTVKGKRCYGPWKVTPVAKVQWLLDKMPERNKMIMETSMCNVERGIQKQVFPMNLGACDYMYGKPCPYKNKCWKNDESMLEYKKEPKEKK